MSAHAGALLSLADQRGPGGPSLMETVTAIDRDYRALTSAGVPHRALAAVFASAASIEATNSIEFMKARSLGVRGLVVLEGPLGVGKSVAAALALRERLHDRSLGFPRWIECEHMGSMSFAGLQRLSVMAGVKADAAELAKLGDPILARTMVLDDVGAPASTSGKARETLAGVLSARVATGWWTVVTTNLDAVGLTDAYGARVVDRLREGGEWLKVEGGSLRRPGKLEDVPLIVERARAAAAAYAGVDASARAGEADPEHIRVLEGAVCRFLRVGDGDLAGLLEQVRLDGERQRDAFGDALAKLQGSFQARADRLEQAGERRRAEHDALVTAHRQRVGGLRQGVSGSTQSTPAPPSGSTTDEPLSHQ